jgi:hypothetical protein
MKVINNCYFFASRNFWHPKNGHSKKVFSFKLAAKRFKFKKKQSQILEKIDLLDFEKNFESCHSKMPIK